MSKELIFFFEQDKDRFVYQVEGYFKFCKVKGYITGTQKFLIIILV